MEDKVLEMPQLIPNVKNSTKQFGFSFSYDAPKVWTELPGDIHSTTSRLFCTKKLNAYLFTKPSPPRFYRIFRLLVWCGSLPPSVSLSSVCFYFLVVVP